jgi:hypothetical protein
MGATSTVNGTTGTAACGTLNLVTNSTIGLGEKKTHGNLDRVSRSQNFPDARRLSAMSPALNTRTLILLFICVVALFEKDLHFCLNNFYMHPFGKQQTILYNIWKNNTYLYTYTCIQTLILEISDYVIM